MVYNCFLIVTVYTEFVKAVWGLHSGRLLGIVSPEQVEQTNAEIEQIAPQLSHSFDVLVDMRHMKAFLQDTKEKIVEHQKRLKDLGMKRASVAVGGAIAKMQLNGISKESEHQTEFQWETMMRL